MNNKFLLNKKEDMRVQSWGDLFKFNKELLEDDFNHGQKLLVKEKYNSADGTTVSYIY